MKYLAAALLLTAPCAVVAHAEQMVPAGSVVQCTVAEAHISSKTTHVGDPVLCQLSRVELYGRSTFPYGSYLEGHFEAFQDPGHFVGKGWMELKFDRMVVGNDTVIPLITRVVATSTKYPVDGDGKIHGTGHPVRDSIEWAIPVLWPIDLINLPRRGPRPVLPPETRLTVKILDDFGIPTKNEVQRQPELISRYNYADNQRSAGNDYGYQQTPAPIERTYAPQPSYYQQPSPTVVVVQAAAAPAAPVVVQQQQQAQGPAGYGYPPPAPYVYAYPPPPYRGYYRPY